jgi:hypothetical protein
MPVNPVLVDRSRVIGAFSALTARSLTSLEFICLTQLALLLSVPLLTVGETSRNDFAAVLFAAPEWGKLAILFAVGTTDYFISELCRSGAELIP